MNDTSTDNPQMAPLPNRDEHPNYPLSLGAHPLGEEQCRFRLWAPKADRVELRVLGDPERLVPMEYLGSGYFEILAENIPAGTRYLYRLDGGQEFPDPASRFQPEGVHKASQVMSSDFAWSDQAWFGRPLDEYVIYELHVGTLSDEGTFDGVIPHLDELQELGVTAVELMPVAQFPGERNWGYDGVQLFAVQNSYGGPDGLHRLIDACHARGLAVVLDVVYNHLGPEGNYLDAFGHYFTDRHQTPWGPAVNFEGPHSDEVRRFFIENALYWIREFHVDALRLDAVHAIVDQTARPFLQELAEAVHVLSERLNRRAFVIAESNQNNPLLISPEEVGGYGMDAQWSDDLHHGLHTQLTGEGGGYYEDFSGFPDLVKACRDGFAYTGQYSPYRGRRHGRSARHLPPQRFVVCAQNHDHVGNRLLGQRLSELVSVEKLKLAAGVVLLSPSIPLLFMGEEYGETAPFQYFVSHTDPQLVEAVRQGRKEEFASFRWQGEPPDPQDDNVFQQCRLNHGLKGSGDHRMLWLYYQRLLQLRCTVPALAFLSRETMQVESRDEQALMLLRRWTERDEAVAIFHFAEEEQAFEMPLGPGCWTKMLDSAEEAWQGAGSHLPAQIDSDGHFVTFRMAPHALALYIRG